MNPILLLLAIAGSSLLMLIFTIRGYSQASRQAESARRRRPATANGTADHPDIAPLALVASDASDDDAAGNSGESDNRHDNGGGGADVGGRDVACGGTGGDVASGDMGSADACGGSSD